MAVFVPPLVHSQGLSEFERQRPELAYFGALMRRSQRKSPAPPLVPAPRQCRRMNRNAMIMGMLRRIDRRSRRTSVPPNKPMLLTVRLPRLRLGRPPAADGQAVGAPAKAGE